MIEKKSGNFADLDYSGMHQYLDDDDQPYGSFEVFYFDGVRYCDDDCWGDDDGNAMKAGYYYWSCFPGCLPDSDPIGPFATSADAYHDAKGY